MPVSLQQIANDEANVTFQTSSGSVMITYFPGHITEKTYAQLQAFSDMSDFAASFEQLNELLAGLIKSWDVYEDDAQTQLFPIEAARLAELPIKFRLQVLNAITGDIRPEMLAPQR